MLCSCGCDNLDHEAHLPHSEYEISPPQGGRRRRPMEEYGGGARRRLSFEEDDEDEAYVPRSLGNPLDPRGSIYSRHARSPAGNRPMGLGPIRGVGRIPELAAMTGLAIVRRRLDFDDVSDIEEEDERGGGCPAVAAAERAREYIPTQHQMGYVPAPEEPRPRQVRRIRPEPATRQQAPRIVRAVKGGGKCLRM